MNAIEIAVLVKSEGAHWFKVNGDGSYIAKPHGRGLRNGTLLDSFSASAIVAVYNGLNEVNRAKFASLPLEKMAVVAFKLMK
jgi:hypothetical protein